MLNPARQMERWIIICGVSRVSSPTPVAASVLGSAVWVARAAGMTWVIGWGCAEAEGDERGAVWRWLGEGTVRRAKDME